VLQHIKKYIEYFKRYKILRTVGQDSVCELSCPSGIAKYHDTNQRADIMVLCNP